MGTSISIQRPQADEHNPYYSKYIDRVPDGDLVSLLREQVIDTVALLRDVSPERANYAYAPGKWTIKEVVGHLIDAERVFAYRALTIARNDTTNLPGLDENAWVPVAKFGDRSPGALLAGFRVVRGASVHLAKHLDAEALARLGSANGHPVSVRALFYIMAGHESHHVALFKEKYL